MLKLKHGQLVQSVDELEELLQPILGGDIQEAAVDTETTPVVGERFTPYASPTRIAGFSVSYGLGKDAVDFYAPVRHSPYDWRRSPALMERDVKNRGKHWLNVLVNEEGVLPADEGVGWQEGCDPNLDLSAVVELWRRMFSVPDIIWLAHNWPFDAKMFEVDLGGPEHLPWERLECTQAISTFTDPRPLDKWDAKAQSYVHTGHHLKDLGEVHLGIEADAQAELKEAQQALGEGSGMLWDYSMLPLRAVLAPYGCMDTRLVVTFAEHARKRKAWQMPKVRALLAQHTLERPLFIDMERTGMPINLDLTAERTTEKEAEVAALVGQACELAGLELKLNDGKGLSKQLYEELGLPKYRDKDDTRGATLKHVKAQLVGGKMPTMGRLTSDQAADLLDLVLKYRKAHKELTAFYRPLAHYGKSGRVHTVLRPLHAKTTRAAAEKPNAMQMSKPKKGKTPEETRTNQVNSVRHLFQPEPGQVFIPLDYGAQELRIAAHYAVVTPPAFDHRFTWRCTMAKRGDCKGKPPHGVTKKGTTQEEHDRCRETFHAAWRAEYMEKPDHMGLVDGFLSGDKSYDPHQAMVTEVERHEVGIDRDEGKIANFLLIYGGGIAKLSDEIDCVQSVAKKVSDLFWQEAYPELYYVRKFVDERLRNVGKPGAWSHQPHILTLHGAPIYLADGFKGLNYLIQRSCREILLQAILHVDQYLKAKAPSYHFLLPVHDELILGAPEKDLDQEHVRNVARIMVSAGAASRIPMVVEPNVCRESWAIKEDLGEDWGWDGVNQGVMPMKELMRCLLT